MLAPWVVDELERIRRERMEREREAKRPRVQIPGTPQDRPESEREADDADREEARRGVVIIGIG